MLRAAILIIASIVLAGCVLAGWYAWPFAVPPVILVLGLLFERYVYKPIRQDIPGPGWERTQERFTDPTSGCSVVVYYHPKTGERRYVASGE
ncbi:MAG TPA: hypothetical protein VGF36_10055 [Rhodopila sp.]|jgi:hypothetical protein